MKIIVQKSIIIISLLIISTDGFSQLNRFKTESSQEVSRFGPIQTQWYKLQWFYDLNLGARFLGPSSDQVNLKPGLSLNGGIGYMFTDVFGLKGRMDYHRFSVAPGFNGSDINRAGSVSFSAELVTDLIPMFSGDESIKYRKYRLGVHTGLGITTVFNPDYKSYRENELGLEWEDPFIKGNDDMAHIIFGFTPQYHINGRWSINLDISSYFQFIGDFTIDQFNQEKQNRSTVISSTLGVTLRF